MVGAYVATGHSEIRGLDFIIQIRAPDPGRGADPGRIRGPGVCSEKKFGSCPVAHTIADLGSIAITLRIFDLT